MTFADKLLAWFDQHGRKDLPWQNPIDPYRVWVSEIMLQQTQVTTVIPYFTRFMQTFPNVAALADASEDEVLHQWTGLGYYARARNLRKSAQLLITHHNGELPNTLEELIALPGIGRSTAGAILSICHDQNVAILDGNVKRVLSRCFNIDGWPGTTSVAKTLWQKAEDLTPQNRNADYTQAIMDVGAMICTRSQPKCTECPFESICDGNRLGRIDQLPGKKPKKEKPVRQTNMVLFRVEDELLLEKRPASGVWGGLWSFPETDELDAYLEKIDIQPTSITELPGFRHTFTHFHLEIQPYVVHLNQHSDHIHEAQTAWYTIHQMPSVGVSKPVTTLFQTLQTGDV